VLLILPGGDGASDSVDALREQLVDHYSVVTYDRRGLSQSRIDAPAGGLTLATHSDDAHRLLGARRTRFSAKVPPPSFQEFWPVWEGSEVTLFSRAAAGQRRLGKGEE
jgi:hypothetical protein